MGLGKPAWMPGKYGNTTGSYPAEGALDGVVPGRLSSSCAHPVASDLNKPAEWWTDLGDVYKILEIVVYGRTDCKYIYER